jgi:hypothetical protein
MAVRWRKVPKSLQHRLLLLHEQILETIKEGESSDIKEYFGITWEDMNTHAIRIVRGLRAFVAMHAEQDIPAERTMSTIYTLGFLTGVRFAADEDHEPPDN